MASSVARDSRSDARQKGELFGADQRVYRAVFDAVMSHRLPPGTRLIESVLVDSLDAPRAVVRMGLLRLAHDRIVELRPNRGAAVASPSLDEARNVYDARRLIEGAIVERLCGRLSRSRLAELRRIVTDGERSFARGDTAQWITAAGRFHVRLAEFTDNPVLADQMRELITRSNLITALHLREGSTVFSSAERRDLIALLADGAGGAPRRARLLMERLLREIENRLEVTSAPGEGIDLRTLFFAHRPKET